MSAKEMFEELGYKLCRKNKKELDYKNKTNESKYIYFDKTNKEVSTFEYITLEELQAINKQIEELGWNE